MYIFCISYVLDFVHFSSDCRLACTFYICVYACRNQLKQVGKRHHNLAAAQVWMRAASLCISRFSLECRAWNPTSSHISFYGSWLRIRNSNFNHERRTYVKCRQKRRKKRAHCAAVRSCSRLQWVALQRRAASRREPRTPSPIWRDIFSLA